MGADKRRKQTMGVASPRTWRMERLGYNKSGQQTMAIPFGLIFSIILIVVFIVIAGIAINHFLDLGEDVEVGTFYRDLQEAVDKAWNSQSSEFDYKIDLPSGITHVCFANLKGKITGESLFYSQIKNYEFYEANIFLIPPEKASGYEWDLIEHLKLEEITRTSNPYCVSVSKDLRIKKDFYDKEVIIE